MPKCTFCRKTYEWPRGITIILNDGGLIYYCSSKCRKNAELKRDNKRVKWVMYEESKKAENSSKK